MVIDSWEKYKVWVAAVVENKKDYYYRGQTDATWKLQTSFHRIAGARINLLDYLNLIIPEVHYHVCAWHNEIINLQDPNEFGAFLALLQHHGFPTPLLDWTLSPYIAAYFAFRDIDDKSPQCDYTKIFIFDFQNWTQHFNQPLDLRNPNPYVSVIRPYAKRNPRIMHQRGAYTVTNVPDMESYINARSQETKQDFLYSVTLPVGQRTQVMRELNLMGINGMALFPGLDGICKTMREQFFASDVVGLSPSQIGLLRELLKKTLPRGQDKDTGANAGLTEQAKLG